jgi:hypothetical protein
MIRKAATSLSFQTIPAIQLPFLGLFEIEFISETTDSGRFLPSSKDNEHLPGDKRVSSGFSLPAQSA